MIWVGPQEWEPYGCEFSKPGLPQGAGCLCCRQIVNNRNRNMVTEDSLEEPELPVLLYWNYGFGSPDFLLPRWYLP